MGRGFNRVTLLHNNAIENKNMAEILGLIHKLSKDKPDSDISCLR
jgi:hypothetical protein